MKNRKSVLNQPYLHQSNTSNHPKNACPYYHIVFLILHLLLPSHFLSFHPSHRRYSVTSGFSPIFSILAIEQLPFCLLAILLAKSFSDGSFRLLELKRLSPLCISLDSNSPYVWWTHLKSLKSGFYKIISCLLPKFLQPWSKEQSLSFSFR